MNPKISAYFASLQRKPPVVAGHVASVTIDPDTGQQTRAQIAIGANLLTLQLDAFAPPLAQGDAVRLAQYGQAASAEYRLAGLEAGGRANTGLFPVLNDGTVLGGVAYPGGDYIFGKLDEGNLHVEAQTGRLYQRVGTDVRGILYPDGQQLFGHCALVGGEWTPDGNNLLLSADALRLRVGETDTIRLTPDGVAWVERKLHVARDGVLQVGDNFGAHIRMGRVVELDDSGNPIAEALDRFAVRVFDGSGLPRIALLTGTPDAPLSPAWLLGLETDTQYLRYQSGVLKVRGEGIFDTGRVGGFTLSRNFMRSENGKVRIVSDTNDAYGEGIILLGVEPSNAGAIRWVDEIDSNWNVGLEYVGREGNTWTKYSHVSTPEGESGYTRHVWVSGGWGNYNRTLTFDSNGDLTGAHTVEANRIAAHKLYYADNDPQYPEPQGLNLVGLRWNVVVPPTAVPPVTNAGSVVSMYYSGSNLAHARLLYSAANGAEIPIALNVTHPTNDRDYVDGVYLLELKLLWKKTISTAYLSELKLTQHNFNADTVSAMKTLNNVEYTTPAASYTTVVHATSDAPLALSAASGMQHYLVVTGQFAVTGQLQIMGVEMTLCDDTYWSINYGA